MIRITSRRQLQDVAFDLGVRKDWHEPDEQNLTARVEGEDFDNAGSPGEMVVVLTRDGEDVATINLATLLAFATGTYEGYEITHVATVVHHLRGTKED